MNGIRSLLCVVITTVLTACNSSPHKTTRTETTLAFNTSAPENPTEDSNNNCVRGAAQPVIDNTVFPHSHFQLMADSSGIETVALDNGDSLIIKNWGCEYYCLTFDFITSGYRADSSNAKYWMESGAELMASIEKGIRSPVHIKKGLEILRNYINNDKANSYANLKFGQDIICDSSDIGETITFEKAEKLANDKYHLGLTFTIGPL